MAGKFEITKAGDGTFSFEFLIDGTLWRKALCLRKRTLAAVA